MMSWLSATIGLDSIVIIFTIEASHINTHLWWFPTGTSDPMHPDTPDPDTLAANRREIFADSAAMLPPSVAETPDLRAKRDERAMAAVVALHPDDDFEARLALRIVAMDFHAGDCLRSAGLAVDDPEKIRRCRAQAASMARQSDAALRSLLRIQATREKQMAEKHPAAMERAGYWFKEIVPPDPAPNRPPPRGPTRSPNAPRPTSTPRPNSMP